MKSTESATDLWCRYCGPSAPLRVEERFEANPLGTFSLAGVQAKFTARKWPYAVCHACGRECRGKQA